MTCNQNCDQGRRCDCTEPKSDLAERLRELDAKATPGPWEVCMDPENERWTKGKTIGHAGPGGIRVCDTHEGYTGAHDGVMGVDAALICALRNKLPAILAALEDDSELMQVQLSVLRECNRADKAERKLNELRTSINSAIANLYTATVQMTESDDQIICNGVRMALDILQTAAARKEGA